LVRFAAIHVPTLTSLDWQCQLTAKIHVGEVMVGSSMSCPRGQGCGDLVSSGSVRVASEPERDRRPDRARHAQTVRGDLDVVWVKGLLAAHGG
jgi:hypothetical protein